MEQIEKRWITGSFGLNPDDGVNWYEKYRKHYRHADERGLGSSLTFEMFLAKAIEAGLTRPDQIGVRVGCYQLGRIGDIGSYTSSNCRFITITQNRHEAYANGRMDHVGKIVSEKNTGKTRYNSEQYRKATETFLANIEIHRPQLIKMQAMGIEKWARDFVVFDPDGNRYEGKNLADFCRTHGLTRSHMTSVCLGDLKHYKGWTGYYPTIFRTRIGLNDDGDLDLSNF